MTFVRLALFPGGTAEQYEALARALEDAPAPASRLAFAAGPVEAGWQVVQIWERREDLEDFNERWLGPATRRLGTAGFPAAPLVSDFVAQDAQIGAGSGRTQWQ